MFDINVFPDYDTVPILAIWRGFSSPCYLEPYFRPEAFLKITIMMALFDSKRKYLDINSHN